LIQLLIVIIHHPELTGKKIINHLALFSLEAHCFSCVLFIISLQERQMKAVQAMTRNVVCMQETDSIEAARDIMKEWDMRHLPVTRDGVLVGILSDRDLLLHTSGDRVSGDGQVADRSVRETMTKKPITCSPADSIAHIAGLMVDNKIDCVPVVEDEDGELVGLITTTDLLDLLREREVLDATRTVPWNFAVRLAGGAAALYP
jgi:CBS domain-containing protein